MTETSQNVHFLDPDEVAIQFDVPIDEMDKSQYINGCTLVRNKGYTFMMHLKPPRVTGLFVGDRPYEPCSEEDLIRKPEFVDENLTYKILQSAVQHLAEMVPNAPEKK